MQINHIIWSKFTVKREPLAKKDKTEYEDFILNDCTVDIRSLNPRSKEKISLFAQEIARKGRLSENCRSYYIGDVEVLGLTSYSLEGKGTINTGKCLKPVAFYAEF